MPSDLGLPPLIETFYQRELQIRERQKEIIAEKKYREEDHHTQVEKTKEDNKAQIKKIEEEAEVAFLRETGRSVADSFRRIEEIDSLLEGKITELKGKEKSKEFFASAAKKYQELSERAETPQEKELYRSRYEKTKILLEECEKSIKTLTQDIAKLKEEKQKLELSLEEYKKSISKTAHNYGEIQKAKNHEDPTIERNYEQDMKKSYLEADRLYGEFIKTLKESDASEKAYWTID